MALSHDITFYQRIQSTRDVSEADKSFFDTMMAAVDAYNEEESKGLDPKPLPYTSDELGALSAYRSLVMFEELQVRTEDTPQQQH